LGRMTKYIILPINIELKCEMKDLERNIILTLEKNPGLSDRELAEVIVGPGKPSQYINQNCRALAEQGKIMRKIRQDGVIGNWLQKGQIQIDLAEISNPVDEISEKRIKQFLDAYLKSLGWEPKIAWGLTHGIDIEAICGNNRWIIEVKGFETLNMLPVNLFVSVIGEILQRMDDPLCKYSIALPDIEPFRRLWYRLPYLAKIKTGITQLFIDRDGKVTEIAI
jgi:hypothetical protein